MSETPNPTAPRKGVPSAFLFIGGGLAGLLLLVGGAWVWRQSHEQERVRAASELFAPAVQQLQAAATAPLAPESVDLDRTVRILHALDLAVEKGREGPEWIRQVAAQDHRGVPRPLLEARARLLGVLQRLYAKMDDQEAQAEYWKFSRTTVLSVLSLVKLDGDSVLGVPVGGSVSVDPTQVKRMLDDSLAAHEERRQLQREVKVLEAELVAALQSYAEASWEILEKWDRLTNLRDRAYLAAKKRDWASVIEASDAAIALSPKEREAHLLKALALVEQVGTGSEESLRHASEAEALLREQVDAHPGASAPALLLLGVLKARTADAAAARLNLEQSAVNFPRQAPRLAESLDPYKVRAYLRKSREGRSIMEAYEQTMLGAGYFSPELQLARLHYLAGDAAAGKSKVMDHFSRRRAQRQWAALAADVQFCSTFLGVHFEQIFPEERWLDLVATESTFGYSLKLKINNRSPNVLRNATLVLVLRFTDMHRDDHETFTPERTLPEVAANAETDFGEIEIDYVLFGRKKTVKDIVSHRAILVSDEAVTWVDTAPVKQAEDETAAKQGGAEGLGEWTKVTGLTAASVMGLLRSGARLGVEAALGRDDVVLTLPRELAILKPSFRLLAGGKQLLASSNDIEGNAIRLKFDSVANFEAGGAELPKELELQLGSRLLSATLKFAPDASGGWVLQSVE